MNDQQEGGVMTHYAALVLTETGSDEEVDRLLAAYSENGEWFADGSRWDWWVIGGRFTGLLDSYAPEKDPANIEACDLCAGTGERPGGREEFGAEWYQRCHGCNGCDGTGQRVKWPTQWAPHDGDRQPASQLLSEPLQYMPHAVVTPDGKWHENERLGWFNTPIPNEQGTDPAPEDLWKAAVAALIEQHPDAVAVVVDCHV